MCTGGVSFGGVKAKKPRCLERKEMDDAEEIRKRMSRGGRDHPYIAGKHCFVS